MAAPAANTFGDTGPNAFNGPGFGNVDLSLFRRFTLTERFKLDFRAESYNLTNKPQYPNPDGRFGKAAFGQITNAGIGSSAGAPTSRRILGRLTRPSLRV